jgi:hypothetical protein
MPSRSRFLPTTRRRLSIVHECDGKEGENNLKLDTKSGEIPSRVFIKSKRDSEDENVILPTIDLTFNPFNTPDEHLPQAVPTAQTRKLGSRTSNDTDDRQDYDAGCQPGRRMETDYVSPMSDIPMKDLPRL